MYCNANTINSLSSSRDIGFRCRSCGLPCWQIFYSLPSLHFRNDLTFRWNMSWTLHFISSSNYSFCHSALHHLYICHLRVFFIVEKSREAGGRTYSVCGLAMPRNCSILFASRLWISLDEWLAPTLSSKIPLTKQIKYKTQDWQSVSNSTIFREFLGDEIYETERWFQSDRTLGFQFISRSWTDCRKFMA